MRTHQAKEIGKNGYSKGRTGQSSDVTADVTVISDIFKKYLQCVLAARILIVDFLVCTLAVKKKSGQVSTCRIGPFPC
jgi:hypothetical protein